MSEGVSEGTLLGPTIIDVVEHYYGDDMGRVANAIAKAADAATSEADLIRRIRLQDFLETYRDTWTAPLEERQAAGDPLLPPLQSGEIRVPLNAHPQDLTEGALAISKMIDSKVNATLIAGTGLSHWQPEVMIMAIRRKLLYANCLVMDCQFEEYFAGNDQPDLFDTVNFHRVLAEVAPLVRDHTIFVTPTPNYISVPLQARRSIGSFSVGLSAREHADRVLNRIMPQVHEAWRYTEAMRFSVLDGRLMLDPIDMPEYLTKKVLEFVRAGSTFTRDGDLGEWAGSVPIQFSPAIFDSLAGMSLPGLPDLKWKDICRVRRDDSFAELRSTLRLGLVAAKAESDQKNRQLAFNDIVLAESNRLRRALKSGWLGRLSVNDWIDFSVSSIIGYSFAGWQGAVGGLVANSAASATLSQSGGTGRSLLAHYASISHK